jgi:hypothetical protein
MVPQGWKAFYSEVLRVLSSLGFQFDSELAAVVELNRKVMPERNRQLPEVVDLEFNFVEYFRDRSLPDGARRLLSQYPPGTLTVRDPQNLCEELFSNTFLYGLHTIHWELDSELYSCTMIPKLNQAYEIAAPSLVST